MNIDASPTLIHHFCGPSLSLVMWLARQYNLTRLRCKKKPKTRPSAPKFRPPDPHETHFDSHADSLLGYRLRECFLSYNHRSDVGDHEPKCQPWLLNHLS